MIHSMMMCSGPVLALDPDTTILPVVPMFHANAWGLVYAGPFCGTKLVFPGFKLDGASLYELLDKEKVTLSAGVPTVWLALLDYCKQNKLKMSSVKRTLIGGSAVPYAMIERFWKEHDVEVAQGWGMTEMSPLGTLTRFNKGERDLPDADRFAITAKQGRPVFGCEMKIIDDAGNDLPLDGSVSGNMVVRGPWIVKGYMKGDGKSQFLENDWFHTGDVCKIESDGSVVITDRSKDVIKSGGEWISSIDLENAAMGCPGVAEAAVIGVAHPKWDERPLLIVVRRPEASVDQGRCAEVPRRQDRQVVDAGRRAVHRRHPARRHRQDPEDGAAQAVRELQAPDRVSVCLPGLTQLGNRLARHLEGADQGQAGHDRGDDIVRPAGARAEHARGGGQHGDDCRSRRCACRSTPSACCCRPRASDRAAAPRRSWRPAPERRRRPSPAPPARCRPSRG